MSTASVTTEFPSITNEERSARFAAVSEWANTLVAHPEKALLGVNVTGVGVGSVGTALQASGHELLVDEPATLAGDNLAATPVEFALSALIACQVVTYRLWAEKLGIQVEDIQITADGDLDTRGFFGIDDSVRPGFQGIQLKVRVTGPETEARYRELQEAVGAHCPVQDLFANATPFSAELTVG